MVEAAFFDFDHDHTNIIIIEIKRNPIYSVRSNNSHLFDLLLLKPAADYRFLRTDAMPRSGGSSAKASSASSSKMQKGEIQRQKSPAEFFADNQAIAGFDNYGKSLYTSIRELMENSLVSE
jgi:hypothetical protein